MRNIYKDFRFDNYNDNHIGNRFHYYYSSQRIIINRFIEFKFISQTDHFFSGFYSAKKNIFIRNSLIKK